MALRLIFILILIYGSSVYTGLFFIFLKKLITCTYMYVILYMWSDKGKELMERRIVNEPQKKQSESRKGQCLLRDC